MFEQKKTFQPKLGQIDYSKARYAPVVNCVVKFRDKILIVQRSADLNFYPGVWNGISGFLDDGRTLEEKVREEMREELGLEENQIVSIHQVGLFEQSEPEYNKVWVVHPVLVEVNADNIKLDWEAQNFKWVTFEEAKIYNLLPGFVKVLQAVETGQVTQFKKGLDFTGVSIVYFCHDGKGNVVLARRGQNARDEQGRWDIGGGGLEYGDTVENTLRQEISQEYGSGVLKFEFLGYRDVHRVNQEKRTHWIALDFKVLVDADKVKNNEPHKFDQIGWFTLTNLPAPLHSQLPAFLEKYKDKL